MPLKFFLSALCTFWVFPRAEARPLIENLKALAQSQIRTVSPGRELHVYHWARKQTVLLGKDPLAPITPNDQRVRDYLSFLRDETYKKGTGFGMAGPGIYAANDPVVTRSYGGDDFILVQFILPEGTRFLDLVIGPPLSPYPPGTAFDFTPAAPFSPEIQAAVAALNCTATDLLGLWENASLVNCRNLRDQVVAALNLSAISYSYGTVVYPAECPLRPTSTFVLFGDKALNWNRQSYFSSTLPLQKDGREENRLIIQSLFRRSSNPKEDTPWVELKDQNPRTDMASWVKKSLMGCGNFPEDLVHSPKPSPSPTPSPSLTP